MTALEELRRIVALEGPIPVAQFMAFALTHPVHGYYASHRDPLGVRGDFTTAPEISQMFGELIGLWAAAMWRLIGSPAAVRLVELGPGRGTLLMDALRALKLVPEFWAAVLVDLVEISPVLRRRQAAGLTGSGVEVAWYTTLAEVPEASLIVIANEFFDAIPIHQAVRAADGWHERMVGLDRRGALTLALHPEPIAGFSAMLPPELRTAAVGAIYEWRSQELILELARRIVRHPGAALIIDYGPRTSGLGDTLQAVSGHQFADVLQRVGEVDLTAHVDFAALGRAAANAGATVAGPVAMGVFLRRLGIEVRAERLKQAVPNAAAAIDTALARLIGRGAHGMGEHFQVMALTRPGIGVLPGFE
jgi:NADH dehydrogenase [ubiquinone] 1 alpha subcomplex assembly factor 7